MSKLIRHAIDIANRQRITGWCFCRFLQNKPLLVQFFLDGRLLGEVKADVFRQDLVDLKVHPTGECGFTFTLPDMKDSVEESNLSIRAKGFFYSPPFEEIQCKSLPKVHAELDKPIVFMHIPKTAGTSFNTYASLFFAKGSAITHIETQRWTSNSEVDKKYSYLAGHLPFGKLHSLFPIDEYSYYSILREPYSHLHSHLNWVRGIGAEKTSGFFKKHPQVIKELGVKLNDKTLEMTTVLKQFVTELDGFEIDFFDNIQARYFLNYRPDRVEKLDGDSAIANVFSFKGVGITENYDTFTQEFCLDNGLGYIKQEQPLNKSKHEPLYDYRSDKFKEILFPLVQQDLKLYDFVKSKLESS